MFAAKSLSISNPAKPGSGNKLNTHKLTFTLTTA